MGSGRTNSSLKNFNDGEEERLGQMTYKIPSSSENSVLELVDSSVLGNPSQMKNDVRPLNGTHITLFFFPS